jgi:hypothetical protein
MPEIYTAEELQAELAKIREAYPSLPEETCEKYAKIALTNKHSQEAQEQRKVSATSAE